MFKYLPWYWENSERNIDPVWKVPKYQPHSFDFWNITPEQTLNGGRKGNQSDLSN